MSKEGPIEPRIAQQPIYWYERGVKKQAWMALDEIAVFSAGEKITKFDREVLIQQLPQGAEIMES
ncbi:MAG: hypothetical protein JRJ73_14315, partial [Deltaproteobacteria bacterium]|nr:hypothetical protein [Deltaproteobacteria bacterium]